jgi:outer membrane protein
MNAEIAAARELQIQSTAEQLKRQEKLYELGGVNKVKLLQLKAQYANEESQLITAQTQLDQSYLTLWQLLNIAPDPNNKVQKPDSATITTIPNEILNADIIYKSFLDKSPEVQAAKNRTDAARLAHSIAIGGRSPRLTVGGSISSFYSTQTQQGVGTPTQFLIPIGQDISGNPSPYFTPITRYGSSEVVPFGDQFDKNLGKNVGFTLSVPIFNGYQVSTNIQKTRINQMSSELTQKQTEMDVYKNVNQAYLDFKSSQKRYESNVNNYAANKEAMTVAEAQFNLGALSTADFIVTKSQYLQAETNLVQAKYELLFRRKVLDFYLGKGLY